MLLLYYYFLAKNSQLLQTDHVFFLNLQPLKQKLEHSKQQVLSQGSGEPSTILARENFRTSTSPKISLFCCKQNCKIETVSYQIFIEHLRSGGSSTRNTGLYKLPGLHLAHVVDLSFSLDREINKNTNTCTASREIPVQCQSSGYRYKENIATHVQNKL